MYRLDENGGIIRTADNTYIPVNLDLNEYVEYLAWKVLGNTPDPWVEPPITVQDQINELEASLTSRRMREAVLNKGQGMQFLQDVEDQITALRVQLP